MYGKLKNEVAVNNIIGPDGSLSLDDKAWGFGANVGVLYEIDRGTRFGITYNSPINLNFRALPQWEGLWPGIRALLASRGLLDANVDLGVTVPQGVNASFYHEIDPQWALLGSVAWQQWSKFGGGGCRHRLEQPVGSDHQPQLQGHLALAGRGAVQAVRSLDAQFRHRIRLGIPGQQQHLARLACKRCLALRRRRPEGRIEEIQLGMELRVSVRRKPAKNIPAACLLHSAGVATWSVPTTAPAYFSSPPTSTGSSDIGRRMIPSSRRDAA